MAVAAIVLGVANISQAVTYTATGMFSDGTNWTATAVFQESAMDSNTVTIDEMDSFVVSTQANAPFLAATYDITEANSPGLIGLLFDGNMAGANVIGAANPTINVSQFGGTDTVTGQLFLIPLFVSGLPPMQFEAAEFTSGQATISGRIGTISGPSQWTHIPVEQPADSIPEPLTTTISLMSLGVLGMTTRRRAAA